MRWWCANCGSERTGEDIRSRCLACGNQQAEEPNEWNTPNGPFMPLLALAIGCLLLVLAACGSTAPVAILPPNVNQACTRAVRCQVFSESQFSQCVACLEHIDPLVMQQLRADYGDLPPLDQVDCETLSYVCEDATNIALCVNGNWRWQT